MSMPATGSLQLVEAFVERLDGVVFGLMMEAFNNSTAFRTEDDLRAMQPAGRGICDRSVFSGPAAIQGMG